MLIIEEIRQEQIARNLEDWQNQKFIAPISVEISDMENGEEVDFLGMKMATMNNEIRKEFLGLEHVKGSGSPNSILALRHNKNKLERLPNFSQIDKERFSAYSSILFGKNEDLEKNILNLIVGLWIFRKGHASLPLYFQKNGSCWKNCYECYEKEKYILTKKELGELEELILKIKEKSDKRKEILVQKLIEVMRKDRKDTGRLIDSVTIIESLITSDSKTEKKFKFSLYISIILKKLSKLEIGLSILNNIYDARSDILHKGTSEKFNKELLEKSKKITRELLKIFFLKNFEFQETKIKKLLFEELKIQI